MPTKFLGSDFQINVVTTNNTGVAGNQVYPQVATLSDGRFAVLYQSDYQGSPADIDPVAALFNADGSFSSPRSRIVYNAANAPLLQTQPAVAALPGGDFGVVFTNERHADGSADVAGSRNITYERVDPNGIQGTPLAIGDFNAGAGHDDLFNPAIATLSTGRQVVVFERAYGAGDNDVFLNVVSADGSTTQFAANAALNVSASGALEANPAVAAIGNTALIVYEDGNNTTTASANISARLFDGATNTLGNVITIADHAGELFNPTIAALDDHRYVIMYEDGNNVFGRIYDTSGPGLSAEFQVDQPGGIDALPSVAVTADGGFIVSWSEVVNGSWETVGRRYNSDGIAMGQQFTVNRLTDNDQLYSSVAVSGANAFFAWTDFAPRPGDASPLSVRGQVMSLTTPPDFNGNGVSDMLWRNSDGTLALWDINKSGGIGGSSFITSGGTQVKPDASWSVVAESDFDGDGRADLVWRNTAGATMLWTMNGSSITSSAQFTSGGNPVNPDPSWSVAGAADFNGDGMSDLLWRNPAGQLALWTLNGSTITGSGFVTSGGNPVNPDPTWSIAGIGDLDGDGKSDLIWRNAATNEVSVWFMNGQTISGSGDLNAGGVSARPDASWSLAGVGDFNADGAADLLWRKSDGSLAMWLMNGSNITSSGFVMSGGTAVNPDTSWHVVEIGDFNGDARTDILWRNDNGALAEWLMKGNSIIASVTPSSGGSAISPDAGWTAQAKPTVFG
jgi:VCBS repeat protein/FG-GAP repeat protein